jgi:hypothetical protein
MLVICPHCDTQFIPAAGTCPACGDYRPPLASTADFETNRAELAIAGGESSLRVHQRLVDKGFSEIIADDIIASARRNVRRTNRRTGGYRILAGAGLLAAGGLLAVVSRGAVVVFGILAIGWALFVAGAIQYVSGANLE